MSTISVSVGGLWRVDVRITKHTTWKELKQWMQEATGVPIECQQLTPSGDDNTAINLVDGDETLVEWRVPDRDKKWHPLHEARTTQAVQCWVASGAEVDSIDSVGKTPLMSAAIMHRPDAVAELLRLGANPLHKLPDGRNILHMYALSKVFGRTEPEGRRGDIVRLLVAAGTDPFERTPLGGNVFNLLRGECLDALKEAASKRGLDPDPEDLDLPPSPRPRLYP